MKITLKQLQQALKDPFIQGLPAPSEPTFEPWRAQAKAAVDHGCTVSQWAACQWVALLFDTYESHIRDVLLAFHGESTPTGALYMTTTTHINGEFCDEDTVVEEILQQAVLKVDSGRAFDRALTGLDSCADSHLLSKLAKFKATFNTTHFTSAKQARDLAGEISPQINARFVQRLLTEVSDEARKNIAQVQEDSIMPKGNGPRM